MNSNDADVIVVGCGPVGMWTALRCAQGGLRVVAVDRETDVYPLPRAIGLDDEIQQSFGRAGLGHDLREHSTPMLGAEFVNAAGERVVGIDLPVGTVSPLGFPFIVSFDQPCVERFIRRAAIAAGVDLRLGIEALDVAPTPDGVRLDTRDGSDPTTLSARWLVAADGAKSTIREVLGIERIDQGFDQAWLVVDTTLLDPDLSLPATARQVCDPARICTLVPGHGRRRRWEFQLLPHETREDLLDDETIAELLSPWGTPGQLQVDRVAVYRFHATVAERFRAGAVFLAGDAAHQMPPFNGQGMCSGMRDAENLSWKLIAVASGRADDVLLDTYDAERRPHATAQVAHAVDAGKLIQAIAHDGEAALESGYGQRPFPRLAHGLVDGDHPGVGRPLPAAAVPTDPVGPGWTLIGDSAETEIPSLWQQLDATILVVPDAAYPAHLAEGTTVVVRPDGYVAAVTTDLTATTNRLAPMLIDQRNVAATEPTSG